MYGQSKYCWHELINYLFGVSYCICVLKIYLFWMNIVIRREPHVSCYNLRAKQAIPTKTSFSWIWICCFAKQFPGTYTVDLRFTVELIHGESQIQIHILQWWISAKQALNTSRTGPFVDVSPPIACHGGPWGNMFGLQRIRNSMVNARDSRFILVRTLDHRSSNSPTSSRR